MFKGYSVDGTENIVISFIFPENKITTIGVRAFDSLYNTKEITIPDSVTTIESEAFYSSISIEKLTLGKNLKTIGDQAFVYANGLKEVIIPDSVKTIGIGAFSGPKIETLKLSSSLESIGDYAFDSTTKGPAGLKVLAALGSRAPNQSKVLPVGHFPKPSSSRRHYGKLHLVFISCQCCVVDIIFSIGFRPKWGLNRFNGIRNCSQIRCHSITIKTLLFSLVAMQNYYDFP